MTRFDEAYTSWRQASFPKGSEDDAVDELHAELAQWDAFVADEVIPIAEGRVPEPGVVDILRELESLRARIDSLESEAEGASRSKLVAYRAYCALLLDVYTEARLHIAELP